MTDVFTILTLPETSNAFTALKSTVLEDDGSGSPPRKTPRLDADIDSASAFRSRKKNEINFVRGGPTKLHVTGEPVRPQTTKIRDSQLSQVVFSIRTLLTQGSAEQLPTTYEGIYTACRSLICLSDTGDTLYNNLKKEVDQCISRMSTALVSSESKGMHWIKVFTEKCKWFETQVPLLVSLLTYLDRIYIHGNKFPGIRELCFARFERGIFNNAMIIERLRSGVHDWATWERDMRLRHDMRDYIPELVAHLHAHGQYPFVFESFYLGITESYYAASSAELAKATKDDAAEFLRLVDLWVDDEMQRSKDVLPVGSWSLVREVTLKALMVDRLEWLANGAVRHFIDSKNSTKIAKLYKLFAEISGLKVLCAAFKLYIQMTVKSIVEDPALDDDMVQRLLDFKAYIDATITSAFVDVPDDLDLTSKHSDDLATVSGTKAGSSSMLPTPKPNQGFIYARNDAFQIGFRARRNKPAELISKYLDKAMRKGQQGASDTDFEALLDSALVLYRFTEDKDVFRTFYHRALAKRLLLERSASNDFEKAMLKKLKEQCDPEFGMGDHMFTDLALSVEKMQEYDNKYDTDKKLSVMVLQRSVWPFAVRNKAIDLPPSMQADLTKYAKFYKEKHQGHKLYWDHQLGTAILKARFKGGQKELSVSLYQAVVLLLFNDADILSFKEILEQTRMVVSHDVEKDDKWVADDAELRRTLQSLACGKKKVLRKTPEGREVGDDDVFRFNGGFADPRAKLHINSIQSRDTPEETKRTEIAVEGDRRHYLDAAIVRVMKAKKELSYEQLKAAIIEAVKGHFVPEVPIIKQRIQSLVEQEYLKRDEDDMNTYVYVA